MSEIKKVNSLGFELNKSVPVTNEEYDQLAGESNAACAHATASTLYRSTFPQFRSLFLHGCDESEAGPEIKGIDHNDVTGIKRNTKPSGKKDEEGNDIEVWDETEGKFWARVKAELGLSDEAAIARFGELAQQCMDRAEFDPKVKERGVSGPRKPAKTYVKIAKQAVEQGKAQLLADKLAAALGYEVAVVGDVEKDTDTLAKAIAANEAKKRKESEAEYAV